MLRPSLCVCPHNRSGLIGRMTYAPTLQGVKRSCERGSKLALHMAAQPLLFFAYSDLFSDKL